MHPTTRVLCGAGVVDRVGADAAVLRDRPKVLLVAGASHARSSGLLAQVDKSLRTAGASVEMYEGVSQNPTVSMVNIGARLAQSMKANVIVGLGGGSVLDAAKAIAVAAEGKRDYREYLSGIRRQDTFIVSALPVIAIPTLPGAGSETNGTSVIIDDETGRKLSSTDELAAPRVALIDPNLMAGAPRDLLGTGIIDALCHAIESVLSRNANVASSALAEQAIRMLCTTGERLPKDGLIPADQMMSIAWATNLAGQALSMAGSVLTHSLSHPVSARFGARHGEIVAALEPAVIATFADAWGDELDIIAGWMGARRRRREPGERADVDDALNAFLARYRRICASLDVRKGAGDMGVSSETISELVRDTRESGSRGLSNMPAGAPSVEELIQVYELAASISPVSKMALAAR